MKAMSRQPRIGDIYYMQFGGSSGSEQKGWRPGLVFQNNTGNYYSPNIIALPLTSRIKKTNQPTHVILPAKEIGLPKDSTVLCENPERMSKDRIGEYITSLTPEYMAKVAYASILSTSAISFLNPDVLFTLWQKAVSLNAIGPVA